MRAPGGESGSRAEIRDAEVCFLDELSERLADLISCGGVGTLLFDQEEGPWQDMAEPCPADSGPSEKGLAQAGC